MMMTMTTATTPTTKRTSLRNSRHSAVHPAWPFRHHTLWTVALLVCLAASAPGIAANAPVSQRKPSPDDCILYATVFTEKGARLPDAEYAAHPAGKKKPHWEGFSDSRGEFAVRVSFQGDYEVEVKAKGYDGQTRKVTSEAGQKLDVVFNLVPRSPKKP